MPQLKSQPTPIEPAAESKPNAIWEPGVYSLVGFLAPAQLDLRGDGSFTLVFAESQAEATRSVGGRWLPGWDDDDPAELTVQYSSFPGIEPGQAFEVDVDGKSFSLHPISSTPMPCGTLGGTPRGR